MPYITINMSNDPITFDLELTLTLYYKIKVKVTHILKHYISDFEGAKLDHMLLFNINMKAYVVSPFVR